MQPVLTIAEMQAVDARALETTRIDELVARAGTAVALAALDLMGGAYGRRVVLVCGKGNNGADGRVAARLLARRGARVRIVPPDHPDAIGVSGPRVDLVVDAAFGTGFRGAYDPPVVAPGIPVLAVDIPSGVAGDTGGVEGGALAAARTVTFVAPKPGLLQGDGARLSGAVEVVDIGLPIAGSEIAVVEDGDLAVVLPDRDPGGNKWAAAVLVVAGSPGMTGAAAMCARAAYRAGAGMVRLGVPGADPAALAPTEAVGIELPSPGWADAALTAAARCRAVVVGPGLGRAPGTGDEVRRLVASSPVAVVVDADGLTALGRVDGRALERGAPVVLTPHDGEYERLAGVPPGPDRIAAARRLAAVTGAVVLLKGPTTAVADPSGRVLLGLAGTPALASAGTGDVLSGVIAAFIARRVPPLEAAALAAHVHGRAGALGHPSGLVAGDLPDLVAGVLDTLG
ncbi:MAG: NAD(P)H-hydrate dehydratase [Acidimicrobiales bacterium]|jgi:NAD(P)H-hydrate epimerase